MTRNILIAVAVAFSVFVSERVSAAGFTSLNAADSHRLAASLQAGDIKVLAENVDAICDQRLKAAKDPNNAVPIRVKESNETLSCLKEWHGLALAIAPDANRRAGINEYFAPRIKTVENVEAKNQSQSDFLGLSWGLGFGYSFGEDDAIDDAEIVDGVLRVKSERKQQPRALLEFHKYFWCNNDGKDGTQGCGPFVALAAAQDDVLSGVGVGLMYGRKAKADESEGFSVGIGVLLDDKVKDLASGFIADQPPPASETAVRFLEKARWSALIFVTRTF